MPDHFPLSPSPWRPSSQAPKRVHWRVKSAGGVKYFIWVVRVIGRALGCENDVESEVRRARANVADPPKFGFERRSIRLHYSARRGPIATAAGGHSWG